MRTASPNMEPIFKYAPLSESENPSITDEGRSKSLPGRLARSLFEYFETEEWQTAQDDSLPHQREALEEIGNELFFGKRQGYVEMPTSTGKTYIMAKLAEVFSKQNLRVLMLAQTIPQVEQIYGHPQRGGLMRFAPTIEPSVIGTHFRGDKASEEDGIVISTYASLNSFARTGVLGEFDVILADEAHRGLGELTSQNLQSFCPDAVKIGFTATPAFSAEKRAENVFGRPFHTIKLREAIESDLVAPVTALVYTTGEEIEQLDRLPEFSQKELDRLIALKSRNDAALEFARNFVADGRQGVIACMPGSNQVHARLLAQELDGSIWRDTDGKMRFIRARAVGSFQEPKARQQVISQFENGYIDVLTFVDILSEGWDSQKASFLIDTCPSTSTVRKKQRLGRVLRKKPGNLDSIVVDFMDVSLGKMQINTLDILEQRYFKLGKVHQSSNSETISESRSKSRLEAILNSELWLNLLSSDTQLIQNLRLNFRSRADRLDPLFAKWEKILKSEGLPAEPKNSMRVPEYRMNEIKKFMMKVFKKTGELPSYQEILDEIESRPEYVESHHRNLAGLALSGFEAELSGHDEDYQIMHERDGEDTEDEAIRSIEAEQMRSAINYLPAREALIMRLRYGIEDGNEWTLDEIGRELDITRERVRQLEGQSLSRLSVLLWKEQSYSAPKTVKKEPPLTIKQIIAKSLQTAITSSKKTIGELERVGSHEANSDQWHNYYRYMTPDFAEASRLFKTEDLEVRKLALELYEQYLTYVQSVPALGEVVEFNAVTVRRDIAKELKNVRATQNERTALAIEVLRDLQRILISGNTQQYDLFRSFKSQSSFNRWLEQSIQYRVEQLAHSAEIDDNN